MKHTAGGVLAVLGLAGVLGGSVLLVLSGQDQRGMYLGAACQCVGLWLLWLWHRRSVRACQTRAQTVREELELDFDRRMEQERKAGEQRLEQYRSSISHSLRMPIAVIQGYADLLAGDVVTEPEVRREYLEKIVGRTQYMTELIGRQGAHSEKLKLKYEQIDMVKLAYRAAADLRTIADEMGIRIQVISPEQELLVRADGTVMSRVLLNLLENSLKYMRRSGTVTILLRREGENISLVVRDDGMGIPEEEVEHVFELYFRGSNHVKGQGYGLYLVRQAALAHGGSVHARSGLGQGMCVTVTVPVGPAEG